MNDPRRPRQRAGRGPSTLSAIEGRFPLKLPPDLAPYPVPRAAGARHRPRFPGFRVEAELGRPPQFGPRITYTSQDTDISRGMEMTKTDSIEAQILELREGINAGEEHIGERLTEYTSECALFGDAGPGMHPSCWRGEVEARVTKDRAALDVLMATPEGLALAEREDKEALDWLNSGSPWLIGASQPIAEASADDPF